MRCVVCGGAIVEAHFANAWEKVRKLFPCCGRACSERFDPDVHWLPAVAPAPLTGPEEARLLSVAHKRVGEGDHPPVVVRELLLAGVGLPGVQKLLISAERTAQSTDRVVKRLNILGALGALLGGHMRFHEARHQQDPAALRAAAADLDAWRARFER